MSMSARARALQPAGSASVQPVLASTGRSDCNAGKSTKRTLYGSEISVMCSGVGCEIGQAPFDRGKPGGISRPITLGRRRAIRLDQRRQCGAIDCFGELSRASMRRLAAVSMSVRSCLKRGSFLCIAEPLRANCHAAAMSPDFSLACADAARASASMAGASRTNASSFAAIFCNSTNVLRARSNRPALISLPKRCFAASTLAANSSAARSTLFRSDACVHCARLVCRRS